MKHQPSFFTLLLLISFASVNAVLFTPALPSITQFFGITEDRAQLTITWFLIGYTLGQLIYGPLANRFGRKPALYLGISLQILSSLGSVLASYLYQFDLLIITRFFIALGSGVGLKMTFTLVNECFDPKIATQKTSLLMMAFAITPGLGVALGGLLNTYWGWESCFYAEAIYGVLLLALVTRLPETLKIPERDALHVPHLIKAYGSQFSNKRLLAGAFLMGCATSFVYLFAAVAPFIAIDIYHMSSANYGLANILPPLGLISGSLISAYSATRAELKHTMQKGLIIATLGSFAMLLTAHYRLPVLLLLFFPMIVIYLGLAMVIANASTIAMSNVRDKSHGSAVMSFLNMGIATLAVLSLPLLPTSLYLLPIFYILLCMLMLIVFKLAIARANAYAN